MKLFSILLIFVSLCGCDKKKSLEYDSTAYPENKEKFGISDYFLFLPKEAFEGYSFNRQKRGDLFKNPDGFQPGVWYVTNVDTKNGSMMLGNGGAGEWATIHIVMWSLSAKEAILVLNYTHSGMEYTSTDKIVFYEFRNNAWTDISGEIIKKPLLDEIYRKTTIEERETFIECSLPVKGLDIICLLPEGFFRKLDEQEKAKVNIVTFVWKDQKFEKRVRQATDSDYAPPAE